MDCPIDKRTYFLGYLHSASPEVRLADAYSIHFFPGCLVFDTWSVTYGGRLPKRTSDDLVDALGLRRHHQ